MLSTLFPRLSSIFISAFLVSQVKRNKSSHELIHSFLSLSVSVFKRFNEEWNFCANHLVGNNLTISLILSLPLLLFLYIIVLDSIPFYSILFHFIRNFIWHFHLLLIRKRRTSCLFSFLILVFIFVFQNFAAGFLLKFLLFVFFFPFSSYFIV